MIRGWVIMIIPDGRLHCFRNNGWACTVRGHVGMGVHRLHRRLAVHHSPALQHWTQKEHWFQSFRIAGWMRLSGSILGRGIMSSRKKKEAFRSVQTRLLSALSVGWSATWQWQRAWFHPALTESGSPWGGERTKLCPEYEKYDRV